ncbi:YncE family protein [Caldimonas brevitalea]|uniref:Serine/threonine protein kinase n=1 Tax=Caldimonas brevitalea TaxID=413882 RepID=A0A0G3BXM8_9BURK|nr:YncE family protein [Caldimonas brevitalea]AKJ32141.1 serine/threonine protein kinase [Caldimonas brevitalea]
MVGIAVAAGLGAPATAEEALKDVLLVGNSEAGTVSVIDTAGYTNLGSVNAVPDLAQRLREMDPLRRIVYETVKAQKGGDRYIDDLAASPDGRTLYVSRSSLADVVALDLAAPGHPVRWRYPLPGLNADHMALSPDGSRVVVSASSVAAAFVLDATSGALVARVETGDFPHANDYSADGRHVYNTSIGNVLLPHALNALKGRRQLTVIDAGSWQVVRSFRLPYGIRPNVVTRDGALMYTQLSYLNGYAKVDMHTGSVLQQVELPYSAWARAHFPHPDDYPQNSAHHGMAISGDERRLCLAGTIDNYVAIVSVPEMRTEAVLPSGNLPYWATTSPDGAHCFVSNSRDHTVSVIEYAGAREVARVQVDSFPQRSRLGRLPQQVLNGLSPGGR